MNIIKNNFFLNNSNNLLNKLLNMKRTIIMGVLNVTPDSFSDGGVYLNLDNAINHVLNLVKEGADIIDIGGESSKPGSISISVEEELKRVIPVIKKLRSIKELDNVLISIDTYKPKVAREAIKKGANILNDITGFTNLNLQNIASKFNLPVIVMHMKGTPKTMQNNPNYDDVIEEIYNFFSKRITELNKKGVSNIILDPGIGFGKSLKDNIKILQNLDYFTKLNYPILIGNSRKSFLGLIGDLKINEREEATISSNIYSVMKGAKIIRVHDVKKNKRAFMIFDKLNSK